MAVACSPSVFQVTSVSRSSIPVQGQSLRSCPQLAFLGVSNGFRVTAMATKKPTLPKPTLPKNLPKPNLSKLPKPNLPKLPKFVGKNTGGKSSWLPGIKLGSLTDPEWLDGSLPGDYGFDPLGLGKDPSALKWFREAEIIHGRWAMAAVIGIFVGQAWSGIPWFEAGADPGALSPFSFGSLLGTQLLLMGWVETKRWIDYLEPGSQLVDWSTPWSRTAANFGNATGLQGYPGGKFFDPLGLAGDIKGGKYVTDYSKLSRLQTAEIKHARIAMLALLTFYFEAGQGLTPLGVLGL